MDTHNNYGGWKLFLLYLILQTQFSPGTAFPQQRVVGNSRTMLKELMRDLNLRENTEAKEHLYRWLSSTRNSNRNGRMLGTNIIDLAIVALGGEVEDEDTEEVKVSQGEDEGIFVGALDILINALGGQPEPERQSDNGNENVGDDSLEVDTPGILDTVRDAVDDALQNVQDFVDNLQNGGSSSSSGSEESGGSGSNEESSESNGGGSGSGSGSESSGGSGSTGDSGSNGDSSSGDDAENNGIDVGGLAASLIEAINQALAGSSGEQGASGNTTADIIVTETEVTVLIKVIASLVETFKSDGTFGAEASSIIISTITAIHEVYVMSSSKKDEAAIMIVEVLTSIDGHLQTEDTTDVDVAKLMQAAALQIEESFSEVQEGSSIDAAKLSIALMKTINSELAENTTIDRVSLFSAVSQTVSETAPGSSSNGSGSGSDSDGSDGSDSSEGSDSSSDSSSSISLSSVTANVVEALNEKLQLYTTISTSTKGEILIKVTEAVQEVYQTESEVTSSTLSLTLIETIVTVINTELNDETNVDTNILIVAVVTAINEVFMEEDSETTDSKISSLMLVIISTVDQTVSSSSINSGRMILTIISGISNVFSMTSSLSEFTSGKVMISVVSSIKEEISASNKDIIVGDLIVLVFKEINTAFESFTSVTEISKQEGTMIYAVVKSMNKVLLTATDNGGDSVEAGPFLEDITKMIHDVYEMSSSESVDSEDLLAAVMMVVSDSVEESQIPSGDSSADTVNKIVTSVIKDRLSEGGNGSGSDITVLLTTALEESINDIIGGVMEDDDSVNSYGIAAAILIATENVLEATGETEISILKYSLTTIVKKSESLIKSKIGVDSVVSIVEAEIKTTLGSSSELGEDVTETYVEAVVTKINKLFEDNTVVNAITVAVAVVEVLQEVSATFSTTSTAYDVDLIIKAATLAIKSNLSNEGGLGDQLVSAAAAAIQNVQDGGNGEDSDMDEIAMAVIAAINDAITAGMSSTEDIIDAVVTAVLGITGIENEDFEEVIETVMQTIQDILGIEEEDNIIVDDEIQDENLSISETSEVMEALTIVITAIAKSLEDEDDGSGVDITDKVLVVIKQSIKKSVSEELDVELVASSVVMAIQRVIMEESEEGQDITFNMELIFKSTEIIIKKVIGVNDVVEVVSKVGTQIREFLVNFNDSSGTEVTESLTTSVETSLQEILSSSGFSIVTANDVSIKLVEALSKTVESETAGETQISFDVSTIVNAAKAVIVQYLGVDIFVNEVTAAVDEIISIGGNGSGDDITELLITTVKRDINDYLGGATEDNNEIVTAQRLAYFIRISLIQLISKIGSFEEVSYETDIVIKSAKIEIREYFEVLSSENDGFSIMDVIDGAVSTICEMLGMCPEELPPPPPLPEPTCSEDFIQFEETCIYVSQLTTARNWVEAQISCMELHPRANLASVHNLAELAFIRSNCSYIGTFFLGGTDAGAEGEWRWNNGRDWNFDNWRPGQPSGKGRENCMEMDAEDGFWNDIDCGGFAGRCSPGIGCNLRAIAPPKRYLCSYSLSPTLAELLSSPQNPQSPQSSQSPPREEAPDPECGKWSGNWPQKTATAGEDSPRPSVPTIPNLSVVQMPNVPIEIFNSPAANIPIILPGTNKKMRNNKDGRKESKKNRSKKNKARIKGQNKIKKNQEKRLKRKKEKMRANRIQISSA